MLTGDLIRPRLIQRGERLFVDSLAPDNTHWQRTAADLIALWQTHDGHSRDNWETSIETYLGDRTDYITVRGLAKVLTDAATFAPPYPDIDSETIRQLAFAQGPAFSHADLFHPRTRQQRLAEVATTLGLTAEQIDMVLYADRPGAQICVDIGPEWTSGGLLTRYNLELHRGVLYWANQMTITIHDTFKDFWRYLKLFRLMFEAAPLPDGYRVTLDGPISPFIRSTTRYGRQFAAFLPALLLCERWQMQATVRLGVHANIHTYTLDHTAELTSHFTRSGTFDSQMEADFAAEFHTKLGDQRGQWLLTREDEVILLGDTVMIPDFAFTHKEDRRRALVEIIGFWHPNYLKRKLEKVRAAGRDDLILLVYEGVNLAQEALATVPNEVLYFKNKPIIKDVVAAVERRAR